MPPNAGLENERTRKNTKETPTSQNGEEVITATTTSSNKQT